MKISVRQLIGEDCLTVEDGRRLYKYFIAELQAGQEVEIDFTGVQATASSFFNASFGFLLRDFEVEELSRLVKVSHLSQAAMGVLKRVVKNCKRYYQRSTVEPTRQNPMLQGESENESSIMC
ncbi:MAG: STAS-like domain-containing protein [Candidatus Paceibacterota bacterium]